MKAKATARDAAVDGLLAGIASGLVMGLFLTLSGILSGDSVAETLSRFGSNGQVDPLLGLVTHMATSSVYGTIYGIIASGIKRAPFWASGLAYGGGLFLLARFIVLPRSGSPLFAIPVFSFLMAHAIYGITLAWLVKRFDLQRGETR